MVSTNSLRCSRRSPPVKLHCIQCSCTSRKIATYLHPNTISASTVCPKIRTMKAHLRSGRMPHHDASAQGMWDMPRSRLLQVYFQFILTWSKVHFRIFFFFWEIAMTLDSNNLEKQRRLNKYHVENNASTPQVLAEWHTEATLRKDILLEKIN